MKTYPQGHLGGVIGGREEGEEVGRKWVRMKGAER